MFVRGVGKWQRQEKVGAVEAVVSRFRNQDGIQGKEC